MLFHKLESVTAAWEQARFQAHYPLADVLLAQRTALLQQIGHRMNDVQGGTQ